MFSGVGGRGGSKARPRHREVCVDALPRQNIGTDQRQQSGGTSGDASLHCIANRAWCCHRRFLQKQFLL